MALDWGLFALERMLKALAKSLEALANLWNRR